MNEIFLVSLGAVLGVNSRYLIYKILEKKYLRKDRIILLVNIFSSFCLGFFLSFLQQLSSIDFVYQFLLFFASGFLGSLSTFSTFIYDLFDLIRQYQFYSAYKLIVFSLSLGIIAFALGFSLIR